MAEVGGSAVGGGLGFGGLDPLVEVGAQPHEAAGQLAVTSEPRRCEAVGLDDEGLGGKEEVASVEEAVARVALGIGARAGGKAKIGQLFLQRDPDRRGGLPDRAR